MPTLEKHIFISYARSDSEQMKAIVTGFRARNYKCWVDDSGLQLGTPSWHRSIETAIEQAGCLVVLLSPASKKSDWVRLEVTYAMQFEVPIFPVLVSGDNRSAVPINLSETQYADITQHFTKGMADLLKSLAQIYEGSDPYASGGALSFLNYRRQDAQEEARLVFEHMVKTFGDRSVFLDVDCIPVGVDFKKFVSDIVTKSKSHLLVIGPEWLTAKDFRGTRRLDNPDDFLRVEAEAAIARGIPLVAALVRDATMPSEESLPPSLCEIAFCHGLPLRKDKWNTDLERLTKKISQVAR